MVIVKSKLLKFHSKFQGHRLFMSADLPNVYYEMS